MLELILQTIIDVFIHPFMPTKIDVSNTHHILVLGIPLWYLLLTQVPKPTIEFLSLFVCVTPTAHEVKHLNVGKVRTYELTLAEKHYILKNPH